MKSETEVRQEMRETPEGRLLVKYGFEPYDTESSARRVAEKAAADIALLEKRRSPTADELQDPKARIAWLEAQGIEGFFLVSGPELVRMQQGAAMLNRDINRWRAIFKTMFGEADPVTAVETVEKWLKVKAKKDAKLERMRGALIDVIQQPCDGPHKDIARKGLKEPT
jgi:hypothetical protein